MPVQAATDYSTTLSPGFKGQVADQNDATIMSGIANGDIPAGVAVVRGATDGSVKVPTAGGTFRGVVARSLHQLEDDATGVLEVQDGHEAPILTRGVIFVEIAATVAVDGAVFFANAGGLFGITGAGFTAIVGASYLDAGVSGDIVRIRIPATWA